MRQEYEKLKAKFNTLRDTLKTEINYFLTEWIVFYFLYILIKFNFFIIFFMLDINSINYYNSFKYQGSQTSSSSMSSNKESDANLISVSKEDKIPNKNKFTHIRNILQKIKSKYSDLIIK